MNDNVINEAFVQELLKSGVWDIARARPKQVDESAKATAEDKAKAVETKDKKEESQQEQTSAEIAENLVKTLDEKVIFEVINFLHNVVNESEDDREVTPEMKLAEETLKDLDKEVISEFVSILYAVAVNESKEKVEDIDEKYTDLFSAINDSFKSLNEEYDLADSTTEDIMEAIVDSLDEDDVEDYSAEEIMEALISFLDEARSPAIVAALAKATATKKPEKSVKRY